MRIDQLTPKLKAMALEEIREQKERDVIKGSLGKNVGDTFIWSESKMGETFWKNVNSTSPDGLDHFEKLMDQLEGDFNRECEKNGFPEMAIEKKQNHN